MKWIDNPQVSAPSQGVACRDTVNRGAFYDKGKIFYLPSLVSQYFNGRMLDEVMGKLAFWSLFVDFNLSFFQALTRVKGMTRRIYTYPAENRT